MGNLNQLKRKLQELEGGAFHRFCDDWLYRRYENIYSIGIMDTTNRTAKGTPDCLFIKPNQQYVFAEYTVQQKGSFKKIKDDITKCLDESKTGIPNKMIDEVIICYLGRLSPAEINELKSLCQEKGIILTLNGLDTIAHSIQNTYPALAESHLSLPLDTGQLVPVKDFIERYGKNKLTTPIDNEILFQNDALDSACNALSSTNFFLISGSPGVGKTLFAINVVKKEKARNKNIKAICLFDKGIDLAPDITTHFSEPGDYLIFVDDANRLDNRLDHLLHYLNQNDDKRNFRIIATVRDYAREAVIKKVKAYTEVHEQRLVSLNDYQIKELIETLYDIKNHEYQSRIQEIADGNPRLAIMASKIAIETNQIESIQDNTQLYKTFFDQNDGIKSILDNNAMLATACAISFFRIVDKSNERQMTHIEKSFAIRPEVFWKHVSDLHKHELVDLYENEVVKISDQVLSTYLFYTAVFEKKAIPFSTIINNFYPDFPQTTIDALIPVINSFNYEEIITIISKEAKPIFKNLCNENDEGKSIGFLNTFSFALQTETLIFLKQLISQMPDGKINWRKESFVKSKHSDEKNSPANLLGKFRYASEEEFKISFDLLINYLEKNKTSLGLVIENFLELYNFNTNDWKHGYFVQKYIIEKLVERMNGGRNYLFTRLFIIVSKEFLKIEHSEHRSGRKNTFEITTFRLNPDNYLLSLREEIIKTVSSLIGENEYKEYLLDLLQEYISRLTHEEKKITKTDLSFLEKYLIRALDKNNIAHCLLVQELCENLDSLELNYPSEWRDIFSHELIPLYNLLIYNEKKMLEIGYEEYNQYRLERFTNFFRDISYKQFADFLEKCIVLNSVPIGRSKDDPLKTGIEMAIRSLVKARISETPEYISLYLKYDDTFEINPYHIISDLFKCLPTEAVWKTIHQQDYRWKKLWISRYFALLPEEFVTHRECIALVEHISHTPSNELMPDLTYLKKYQTVDSKIYQKIVQILVNKSKEDINYAKVLVDLFKIHSKLFGNWFEDLKIDKDLVYEAYLLAFRVASYSDYSGEALKLLIEKNPKFIYRLIDQIYEKERSPDSHTIMPETNFLWERDSYLEDIECYARYIKEKIQDSCFYRDNMVSRLFIKVDEKNNSSTLTDKKQYFLKNTVQNNSDDIEYICFIFHQALYMGKDFIRELFTLFISCNKNLNNFRTLEHTLRAKMWSGSRVPVLEKEKNFLENLLPIFDSIDFIEHRAYVEEEIESQKKCIEDEKKKDFLESS